MGDLATLWPYLGGGVFGILVIVIIVLLRGQSSIASTAELQVKNAEERADAAEARELAAREVASQREARLQNQLDEQLALRRRAEDLHAQVLLEVRALRFTMGRVEGDMNRIAIAQAPAGEGT